MAQLAGRESWRWLLDGIELDVDTTSLTQLVEKADGATRWTVALTQLAGRSRELVTLLGGRELDAVTLPLALQNMMGESWMRTLKRWQT